MGLRCGAFCWQLLIAAIVLSVSSNALAGSAARAGAPPDKEFDDFYRANWTTLVRFATLTTGSVGLAEEIVQESLTEVLRRWDVVEYPAAYARQSVANRCVSWVRRQQVERRVADKPELTHDDPHLVEMLDALRGLRPRQRAAVVLRYWADLNEHQIAEALRCRPGTVKSLLARARETLRASLGAA